MKKKKPQMTRRNVNQQKIIRLLCERETINQVDIADEINASLPTVITNVNELVREGILEIGGVGDSRGGRKPVIVNLNQGCRYTIGIDFLVDTIKIVIFNFTMKVVAIEEIATSRFIHFDDIMEKIINIIRDMLLSHGIVVSNLLGIGISIPGIINNETKSIEVAPNLHIADTHLKKYSTIIDVPVYFENEANAASYAEWQVGAARGARNVLYVSIMKGVGAGIILDNKLYRGTRYKAGEVGHIIIHRNGRMCTCGEKGCLNEYISAESLCKEYSRLSGRSIEQLSDFMKQLDREETSAQKLWAEYIEDFACALRMIVSTVDPDTIVIGGEIARYSDILIPSLQEQLKGAKSNVFSKNHNILSSQLMENASITGVALYLRNSFISNY